jgi:hypothetical protein
MTVSARTRPADMHDYFLPSRTTEGVSSIRCWVGLKCCVGLYAFCTQHRKLTSFSELRDTSLSCFPYRVVDCTVSFATVLHLLSLEAVAATLIATLTYSRKEPGPSTLPREAALGAARDDRAPEPTAPLREAAALGAAT